MVQHFWVRRLCASGRAGSKDRFLFRTDVTDSCLLCGRAKTFHAFRWTKRQRGTQPDGCHVKFAPPFPAPGLCSLAGSWPLQWPQQHQKTSGAEQGRTLLLPWKCRSLAEQSYRAQYELKNPSLFQSRLPSPKGKHQKGELKETPANRQDAVPVDSAKSVKEKLFLAARMEARSFIKE